MKNGTILVADGLPLQSKPWKRLKNFEVIALDGAANAMAREGSLPHGVLGDLDSISKKWKRHLEKKKVPFVFLPDQNFTDFEKALQWCKDRGVKKLWVFQALGKRLDHSLHNLFQLKRFRSLNVRLFSETETIYFVQNSTLSLRGKKKRRFAVFPLPRAKVSSSGLRWELKLQTLQLGKTASVCNEAHQEKVQIRVWGSALVIEEGWNFS